MTIDTVIEEINKLTTANNIINSCLTEGKSPKTARWVIDDAKPAYLQLTFNVTRVVNDGRVFEDKAKIETLHKALSNLYQSELTTGLKTEFPSIVHDLDTMLMARAAANQITLTPFDTRIKPFITAEKLAGLLAAVPTNPQRNTSYDKSVEHVSILWDQFKKIQAEPNLNAGITTHYVPIIKACESIHHMALDLKSPTIELIAADMIMKTLEAAKPTTEMEKVLLKKKHDYYHNMYDIAYDYQQIWKNGQLPEGDTPDVKLCALSYKIAHFALKADHLNTHDQLNKEIETLPETIADYFKEDSVKQNILLQQLAHKAIYKLGLFARDTQNAALLLLASLTEKNIMETVDQSKAYVDIKLRDKTITVADQLTYLTTHLEKHKLNNPSRIAEVKRQAISMLTDSAAPLTGRLADIVDITTVRNPNTKQTKMMISLKPPKSTPVIKKTSREEVIKQCAEMAKLPAFYDKLRAEKNQEKKQQSKEAAEKKLKKFVEVVLAYYQQDEAKNDQALHQQLADTLFLLQHRSHAETNGYTADLRKAINDRLNTWQMEPLPTYAAEVEKSLARAAEFDDEKKLTAATSSKKKKNKNTPGAEKAKASNPVTAPTPADYLTAAEKSDIYQRIAKGGKIAALFDAFNTETWNPSLTEKAKKALARVEAEQERMKDEKNTALRVFHAHTLLGLRGILNQPFSIQPNIVDLNHIATTRITTLHGEFFTKIRPRINEANNKEAADRAKAEALKEWQEAERIAAENQAIQDAIDKSHKEEEAKRQAQADKEKEEKENARRLFEAEELKRLDRERAQREEEERKAKQAEEEEIRKAEADKVLTDAQAAAARIIADAKAEAARITAARAEAQAEAARITASAQQPAKPVSPAATTASATIHTTRAQPRRTHQPRRMQYPQPLVHTAHVPTTWLDYRGPLTYTDPQTGQQHLWLDCQTFQPIHVHQAVVTGELVYGQLNANNIMVFGLFNPHTSTMDYSHLMPSYSVIHHQNNQFQPHNPHFAQNGGGYSR